MDDLSIKVAD